MITEVPGTVTLINNFQHNGNNINLKYFVCSFDHEFVLIKHSKCKGFL